MKTPTPVTGLCLLALAIFLHPVIDRVMSNPSVASANYSSPALPNLITATALGQSPPTIVWYGTNSFLQSLGGTGTAGTQNACSQLYRAWSDGRVEVMATQRPMTAYSGNQVNVWCTASNGYCQTPWVVISDPNQGYASSTDVNADASVDGADLAMMLANWGDAPRHDIQPSDCPLNLINP